MKKNDVQMAMLEGLEEMLGDQGFKLRRTEKCLVRKVPQGSQRIMAFATDYAPQFFVTINAFIRIDSVEQLTSTALGRAPAPQSFTLNIGLEYFSSEQLKEVRIGVRTSEDIENSLHELQQPIMSKLLPFLDTCNNVQTVENLLNWSPDHIRNLHYPTRGVVSVVTAFLANPERFDEVVKRREDELVTLQVPFPYAKMVSDTISYLRDLRAKGSTD